MEYLNDVFTIITEEDRKEEMKKEENEINDKIESIKDGYKSSKIKNKEDGKLILNLRNESRILTFFRHVNLNDLKYFFMTYNICKDVNFNNLFVKDPNDNDSIILEKIIKRIIDDYLLGLPREKGLSENFIANMKFNSIYINPFDFIRYYDPQKEIINEQLYLIDFSNKDMIDCDDRVYQTKDKYKNCKVVGFFKADEISGSFWSHYFKFSCLESDNEKRKVLVWNLNDFPVDETKFEFRPIQPFEVFHSETDQVVRTYKNQGEYVLRTKGPQKFLIPVQTFESLNEYLWKKYKQEILIYLEQEKNKIKDQIEKLYLKYGNK
jgi:hypothetical protein